MESRQQIHWSELHFRLLFTEHLQVSELVYIFNNSHSDQLAVDSKAVYCCLSQSHTQTLKHTQTHSAFRIHMHFFPRKYIYLSKLLPFVLTMIHPSKSRFVNRDTKSIWLFCLQKQNKKHIAHHWRTQNIFMPFNVSNTYFLIVKRGGWWQHLRWAVIFSADSNNGPLKTI